MKQNFEFRKKLMKIDKRVKNIVPSKIVLEKLDIHTHTIK